VSASLAGASVQEAASIKPRMSAAVRKKNHGDKKHSKSEFALTGRGLRKYKKLYLKTVPGNLVYP
jgi:hypothetical protein